MRNLAALCLLLAFCVTVLGSYVRLSDAGLGCPDWPGCYGKLLGVPETPDEIARAREAYPSRPVAADKAWKEMLHRYAAGVLGILVFILAFTGGRAHRLPWVLCGLIIFQSLLGMWTVTLLLKPLIVVVHLLGGMAVIALLTWLLASQTRSFAGRPSSGALFAAGVATLVLVFAQIALGGWVSANYAALACPDFPSCRTQWWPEGMDFASAASLWGEVGADYEFGRLDDAARMAVHMMHRLGALILILAAAGFFLSVVGKTTGRLRGMAAAALLILAIQAGLGVANVVYSLPLTVAVAHNAGAALLLMAIVVLVVSLKNEVRAGG